MNCNERKKQRRDERKALGLCVDCGKPLDGTGTRCISCAEKHRISGAKSREYYRNRKICYQCKKQKIMGDEKICPECSAKYFSYYVTLDVEQRNAKAKRSRDKAKAKAKENGMCIICYKNVADIGFKTCSKCRNKKRIYQREKRHLNNPEIGHRYANRIAQGICVRCDEKAEDGYKVCVKCHEKLKIQSRSANCARARKRLIKEGILY